MIVRYDLTDAVYHKGRQMTRKVPHYDVDDLPMYVGTSVDHWTDVSGNLQRDVTSDLDPEFGNMYPNSDVSSLFDNKLW